MAKYLLLKHYQGGPERNAQCRIPMEEWTPQEISDHVAFMGHVADTLRERAAITALHADAATAAETDWTQVLEWYDELARLTPSPVVALNRAGAVGEVDGPLAGLRALADVDSNVPRHAAVEAYLHERAGDVDQARTLYGVAARAASSPAERDHLTRQAARLR